jgi:sensor histidine kinase YesM
MLPGYIPRASLWHLELVATILGACSLVALCWSFYLGVRRQLQMRALDVLRLENAAVRAQLDALQARLNPHFLFNSLNVIAALARRDAKRVEEVALDLAEIYRCILRSGEVSHPTLDDELELVRRYLAIEQTRLGERLTWEISIEEGLGSVGFPPLLLQPLVENAVVHGVGKSPSGGAVRVAGKSGAGRLTVLVDDEGPGCPPATGPEGFGLGSVRERLLLLFAGRASLTLAHLPEGGTRASVEIPLEDESRAR